jgi:hypothetical protein
MIPQNGLRRKGRGDAENEEGRGEREDAGRMGAVPLPDVYD